MLANEKPELLAASESLYKYNREEDIRLRCIAREEYRRDQNTIARDMKLFEEAKQQLVEKEHIITELEAQIKELQSKLAQQPS